MGWRSSLVVGVGETLGELARIVALVVVVPHQRLDLGMSAQALNGADVAP